MANTKEKVKLLKDIHTREEEIFRERNEKYGDSFSRTYQKRGPAVALIRMDDKLSRADYMITNGLMESNGESLIDTLMDLSNYANMTIMELMGDTPVNGEKPKRKKKAKKAEDTTEKEETEKGPLDGLSKRQLISIIEELGGSVPKKANRAKLYEAINGFPKAKVAVIITSMVSKADGSQEKEGEDGEE